MMTELSELFL